jgi:hypothetical protein
MDQEYYLCIVLSVVIIRLFFLNGFPNFFWVLFRLFFFLFLLPNKAKENDMYASYYLSPLSSSTFW